MKSLRMMMLAVVACMLTGCAPSVVTDMFTSEYAATSPDSVRVFQVDDEIPSKSLEIGRVKVIDGGLAVGGNYEHVLGLAVKATAKNGGNGLVINEHRAPDLFSSIHRIYGTMLYMPQVSNDPSAVKESVRLALARSEHEDIQRYKNARQLQEQAPHNILRFNIGPSWLTSEFQTNNKVYKSKSGIDVEAGYDHVWKAGFGIGVNYLHSYTSFDEGVTMRLNYFGPSLVMALPLNKSRLDGAIGFGYCSYSESYMGASYSESHIAPMMRIGWEYAVSRQMALGLQIHTMTIKMDEPEGIELNKNEFYGIKRWGLSAGMRFYF